MASTFRTGIVIALAAAALAGPAGAATQLFATRYDMPNGDGQARGGTFNYWDASYSGAGAKTVDGDPLSGGLGDLTDGVVAADVWYNSENAAGTGPYVGWYGGGGVQAPTITFYFAAPVAIDTIRIQLDNSGVGGVYAPVQILVDGLARSFTSPAFGTAGSVDLTGLGLTGASHTVQFIQDLDQTAWVFTSEVSFFGDADAVPEPAAWTLLIAGFALTGAALRRRRLPAVG